MLRARGVGMPSSCANRVRSPRAACPLRYLPCTQLAACEFWDNFLVYAGDHVMLLREHFDKLIPVLLKCMVYSDDELADLPTEDVADEGEADRKEDVAPFIYRSHRGGDDDDGGGDSVSQWTLRRCAAYTLDGLARHFGHVVLPFILGELNSRFGTDDDALWLVRGRVHAR